MDQQLQLQLLVHLLQLVVVDLKLLGLLVLLPMHVWLRSQEDLIRLHLHLIRLLQQVQVDKVLKMWSR
jgi:hypothetical protein